MAADLEAYQNYPGFLKSAIKRFWSSDRSSKLDLLALLLATREAWEVAWDGATSPQGGRSLLKGAAGAAAVTVLLRTVLGGPIGLLLTGVSVASLGALYVKHNEKVWMHVELYKKLVDEFRPAYDELQYEFKEGGLRESQRDLMIDGLMSRFMDRLEAIPHVPVKEEA